MVAFGMIGTALSGVTFISVPGDIGNTPAGLSEPNNFSYFQFILGNAIGFVVIAYVLLPLYYRLQLTSIYSYLEDRLGHKSYKSGAMIFLISRTIGSAFRLVPGCDRTTTLYLRCLECAVYSDRSGVFNFDMALHE